MSEEMKLITALCEALGFEVEAVMTKCASIDHADINKPANYTPPEYSYELTKIEDESK